MLNLPQDKPEDIPLLPEGDSDIVREAGEELRLDRPLDIPEKAITVLRVRTGKFTLNVSINTLRKADRLVVTFMPARAGGVDPINSKRPAFARRHWDVLFNAPILAISDPQTEVDWQSNTPRSGFYLGTFQDDLVPEILALIDKVCDELGIARDRVVMYGASAGGTAAILVGSRRTAGTGIIAVNPYLRPDKFREQLITTAVRAAGGTMADWETINEVAPWRNNPLTALRDGLNEGHETRLVVAQNVRDKTTINRHFPGLWRRFEIDPEGGVATNGRVMAMLYDEPEAGHGAEPRAYSAPLVAAAYDFFDRPVEPTPRKDKKLSKARRAAKASTDDADADIDEIDDADDLDTED